MSYSRIIFFNFIFLFSIISVQAIGIGVSPPDLALTKGVGNIALFNPSNEQIDYHLSALGDLSIRPTEGSIAPMRSAQVIVYGKGEGIIDVFASPTSGVEGASALPAIEVVVHGEDNSLGPMIIYSMIGGIVAIVIAASAIILARRNPKIQNNLAAGVIKKQDEPVREKVINLN